MASDWTQIYKKYKGRWVAFLDDERTIFGSGKTATEALAQAQKKGTVSPILVRMPEDLRTYAGSV